MPYIALGRRCLRLLVLSLLLFPLFPAQARASPAGVVSNVESTLVIGEVGWAGSSSSTADEWLELWNMTDSPISLNGFRLVGAGGKDGIQFGGEDVIAQQSALLIANYDASADKTTLLGSINVVTTTISLSNDALAIELLDPQGTIVDQVGDGKTPPAGSSKEPKSSMIRQFVDDESNTWITATTSINFKPGATDRGTPGICDRCASETMPESAPIIETPEEISTTTTSSTIILNLPDYATSSFISVSPALGDTTTSTTSTSQVAQENQDATSTLLLTSQTTTPIVIPSSSSLLTGRDTNSLPLFFDEIAPAPGEGNEWIELYAPLRNEASLLAGWTVEHQDRVVFTWNDASRERVTQEGWYLVIQLARGKLRNDGAELVLKNPIGQVMDRVTYPTMKKDEVWVRFPDEHGAWQRSTIGTPWQQNMLAKIPVAPTSTSPASSSTNSTEEVLLATSSTTIQNDQPKTIAEPIEEEPSEAIVRAAIVIKSATTNNVASSTKKTAAIKTTKPKTTTTKVATTPVAQRVTFDALSSLESDMRIRVKGTVATMPGLIAKNQFALLAPDGRGLLVVGNSKQPSPILGQTIEVTGSLLVNDDGASLHMKAADRWINLRATTTSETRSIDLASQEKEDAWSFVSVTGTVSATTKTTITIDLDDGQEVVIAVKPMIKLRAQRFLTGDTIAVQGLFDIRHDTPTIVPRNVDEVALVSHAPPKPSASSATSSTGVPPWTPFAAAGATVAIAQGIKKARTLREQWRLKHMLERAAKELRVGARFE